jgi:hypothetical protein
MDAQKKRTLFALYWHGYQVSLTTGATRSNLHPVVACVIVFLLCAIIAFLSFEIASARLSFPWAGTLVFFLMICLFVFVDWWLSRLRRTQETARTKIEETLQTGSSTGQERDAINELYVELRQLISRSAGDSSLNPEVQRRLAQLRALQREEAEKIRRSLDEGLHLKPGSGYQALDEARRLLAEYAHPAPQNLSSSR